MAGAGVQTPHCCGRQAFRVSRPSVLIRGLGAFPVAEGCQWPVDIQPGPHRARAEAPRRPRRDMV